MKTNIFLTMVFVSIFYSSVYSQSAQDFDLFYDDGTPTVQLKFLWNASTFFTTRFTPPSVPAKVVKVKYYIAAPQGNNEFDLMIFSETGQDMPSTVLLDRTPISGGTTGWNTIDISEYEIMVNGDFYIALVYNGTPIVLGAETTPPLSGRTYDTDC
jgi:hypothetical protein